MVVKPLLLQFKFSKMMQNKIRTEKKIQNWPNFFGKIINLNTRIQDKNIQKNLF
jgi:hypothetical protein